jgi:hypothetical protein
MKKLKTLLFIFAPLSLFAQISKNQWLVGGGALAQYSENNLNSNKEVDVRVPSQIGYFVADKFAMGVRGQYHFNMTKSDYFTGNNYYYYYYKSVRQYQKEFSVGPFIRYYFLPTQNRFNLFLDLSYGYGKSTSKIDLNYGPIEYKRQTNILNVNIAPVFIINKHLSTELMIAYFLQKEQGAKTLYTDFLVGLGFQIHLGKAKEKSK